MSSPFVAEIRIFACNFAPTGWAYCDGQILPLSQNTALFSLLGTMYGGNGKSNFALPNMQGRAPIHQGQGPGLSDRFIGEEGGTEFVTLIESEMPSHTHAYNYSDNVAERNNPGGNYHAVPDSGFLYTPPVNLTPMSSATIAQTGGGLPHNNMPPYLTLNFCIALQGIFPPRG